MTVNKSSFSVVVLISGSGSNLQSIIDNADDIGINIACVISNKADAFGLERAKKTGIPTQFIDHTRFKTREDFDQALIQHINTINPRLVILAGFMRILSAGFINAFAGKIINIHPALLPKFKGLNTHQRAIDAGEEFAGATVHFVSNELDSGEVILQQSVPIKSNDTAETLAAKVLKQEHILYPKAIKKVCRMKHNFNTKFYKKRYGSMTQTQIGKAFEYAILKEFNEKLSDISNVEIIQSDALKIAKYCFNQFEKQAQGRYLLTASFAVNFLMDIEPRLKHGIGEKDILELEILTNQQGQLGDVRDVVAIRKSQKWEIGVSAKNNHKAIKHSRLSNKIDFGKKWLGIKCSKTYFDEISLIFDPLKTIKIDSKSTQKWNTLSNKEDNIYIPILKAFKKELNKIYTTNPKKVAGNLVEYLVGSKDFYKVIKGNKEVEIQAYNLHGTLNLPFKKISPKFKTPKINLPNKIISINFKENSKTTLIIKFDNDWALSFRIHNASSKIEPSLKFDINLLESPNSLFTNTLSLPQ